jgi:uncharacterized protein YjbI with pentapeptide repeats
MPATPRPADPSAVELANEAVFRQLTVVGLDLSGQGGDGIEFEQCGFTRATLARATMEQVRFVDCVVDNSDWANASATKSGMLRVEFHLSRLTGLHWIDGSVRDVTFRECRMDLATFRFTSFKDVEFVDCNLTRADFTRADLRGARFRGCDLSGAQFAEADCRGTRFTRCELVGLGSVTSLKGATINPDDLAALSRTLAAALGITIADT